MKVWITKYALTKGIYQVDCEVCSIGAEMILADGEYFLGQDWHTTKKSAVIRAKEMLLNEIQFVEGRLKKLCAMTFE